MRGVLTITLCLVTVTVFAQAPKAAAPEEATNALPRLSLPSAHLLGKEAVAATYAFRGATYEGRDMTANQFGLTVGVTDRIELAWDYHDIDVNGRTAGNTFDVHATGWQVRYGQELFNAPGALFLQYRDSNGRVVEGGNIRIPPDASALTLGAVRSSKWGDKDELHLVGSLARSEVGGESSLTWAGGAGIDHQLGKGFTASGDVALFKETGDVASFEAAICGGVHYQHKSGLSADVMGSFLPSGTPLAGNALADGSVFVLDPVFRNEPIVRDFQNDSLGFYTIRVGYTRTF